MMTLFVCFCVVVSSTYCIMFFFVVCAIFSLDCPFLIAPSVFSNIYYVQYCYIHACKFKIFERISKDLFYER